MKLNNLLFDVVVISILIMYIRTSHFKKRNQNLSSEIFRMKNYTDELESIEKQDMNDLEEIVVDQNTIKKALGMPDVEKDTENMMKKVNIEAKQSFYDSNCKSDRDCNHGTCNQTSLICTCFPGYVTLSQELLAKYGRDDMPINIDYSKCNYPQKSRFIAFLLSLLFGIGLDHLYVGDRKILTAKLIYFFVIFIIYLLYQCCCKNNPISEIQMFCKTTIIVLLSGYCLWWLIDIICFYNNSYVDFNGIKLI